MLSQIAVLLSLLSLTTAIVKVTWPNYSGPPLDTYSGYVTVDELSGRNIHYVLIKAENNPSTAPLVVWYQGGPGCSGLYGLFAETGPLRVIRTAPGQTALSYSPLGWTQFANMLFVEQPSFVGFSYSNNVSDHNTGDVKAAMDNYKFLQLFVMTQFPEFMGRDLWFTGESYGGVYVPMLSAYVTSNSSSVLYKMFKGFMIGNPVFSCQGGLIGSTGAFFNEDIQALYWHGIVSYTNYNNWTMQGCTDPMKAAAAPCQYIYNLAMDQIGEIVQEKRFASQTTNWPSLDPDDIFQDFCTGNGSLSFINSPLPQDPPMTTCDSELSDLITEYLNTAVVQYALAVKPVVWASCSPLNYDFTGLSMVTFYQSVLMNKPGVKILVYSGDLDILTVPLGYTMPCLSQISKNIMTPWQPWFVNGVTAGYVEVYDMFTYATLKGAGHEAPQYQPVSGYQLVYRFMMNGNLNENSSGQMRTRTMKPFRSQSDMLRYYGLRSR